MEGTGQVQGHHKRDENHRVPQLAFSVVGNAYHTQYQTNEQCRLHVEKLTEDCVCNQPVVSDSS